MKVNCFAVRNKKSTRFSKLTVFFFVVVVSVSIVSIVKPIATIMTVHTGQINAGH